MTALRRVACTAALLLAAIVALAAPAGAAQPTIERFSFSFSFPDVELSEACGVEVTTTVSGSRTERLFDEEGTGPVAVNTLNVSLTFQAGDNVARLRDVGADVVLVRPNGDVIVNIIGQAPFNFRGVLKFFADTEEVILEPKDWFESDLKRVCDALTS